ncbi:sugar phosphate isomerase/epimerase family protein [Pseudofrankia asymbiotica]|uniref:sugar phosphate isomerase/epimerase family protein n=1 Tax=Pseudofrankia asymbiotica TaxID=1834516 RepID=UPI0013043620|nr:TIM barrel protein [Pseudofrankia asymbiotica]
MRVRGIVIRDFPVVPGAAEELIRAAAAVNVSNVHVNPPRWIGRDHPPGELRAIGAALAEAGLTITVDLGAVNPAYWPNDDLSDRDGTRARIRLLREAALLGVESVHVRVGSPESRDDPAVAWEAQKAAATRALAALGPTATELEIAVVLKTHEEMASAEALAIADEAGEHVRLGYSAVNLLAVLEDPVVAARRLARRVHTVFLDDAAMVFTAEGMARRLRPLGEGIVDWPAVLAVLPAEAPLIFDLHRAELTVPLYREGWIAARPTATVAEILRIAAAATPNTPSTALDERRRTGLALLPALASIAPGIASNTHRRAQQ